MKSYFKPYLSRLRQRSTKLIFLGACFITPQSLSAKICSDPESENPAIIKDICISSISSSSLTHSSESSASYLGLLQLSELDWFITHAFSTHWRLEWLEQTLLSSNKHSYSQTQWKDAYFRLGSQGQHRILFEVGRMAAEFGVGKSWNIPALEQRQDSIKEAALGNGVRLVMDNLRNLLVEVTALDLSHDPTDLSRNFEPTGHRLGTLRVMGDSGSETQNRLFSSAQFDSLGRQQFGLGILSIQNSGNQTILEWARTQKKPSFAQIWEITYWQPTSRPFATHAKFSERTRIYRAFSLAQVYYPNFFKDQMQISALGAFKQDISGFKNHRWEFTIDFTLHI